MPRDMEQFQLLMALSLYVTSLQNIPIVLVPATPEMLFGSNFKEAAAEIESYDNNDDDEFEFEYEDDDNIEEVDDEETDQIPPSPAITFPPAWRMDSRVVAIDDEQDGTIEELPLVHPV